MKDVHLKPYLSNMGLKYCNYSSQSSPKVGIIFGCSFESEIARLTTLVWLLVVVLPDIGDNIAYTDGLHFCCEEVYPYRNRKKV
jgi:hypothetical protein